MIKAIALASIIAFTVTPIQAQKGKPVPKQPPAATQPAPTPDDPSRRTLEMYCMPIAEAIGNIKKDELQLLFAGKLRYGIYTVYANPKTRIWVSLLVPTADPKRACLIGAAEGYRLEWPGFPA